MGVGDTTDKTSPTAVSFGGTRYAQMVDLGEAHSCALLDDNSVVCWGSEAYYLSHDADVAGLLGYGTETNYNAPPASLRVDLGTDLSARQIEVGFGHSCAILSDHTVKCWGGPAGTHLGAGTSSTTWGDGPDEMGDDLPVVDLL